MVCIGREPRNVFKIITDTIFISTNPYYTAVVFIKGADAVLRNAFVIPFIIYNVLYAEIRFIQYIDPAMVGADPYLASVIL